MNLGGEAVGEEGVRSYLMFLDRLSSNMRSDYVSDKSERSTRGLERSWKAVRLRMAVTR